MAGEEESPVVADDTVRSGCTFFRSLICGNDVDDLLESELATAEVSLVNRGTQALFVTEVNQGKRWMVGYVARASGFGWIRIMGIESCESAGVRVEGILKDSVRVFDLGNINETVFRGGQYCVCSVTTFVEEGDSRTRVSLFVQGVDANMTTSVVSSE